MPASADTSASVWALASAPRRSPRWARTQHCTAMPPNVCSIDPLRRPPAVTAAANASASSSASAATRPMLACVAAQEPPPCSSSSR